MEVISEGDENPQVTNVQQQAQTLINYSGISRLPNPFITNEETKNAEDYLSRLGFSQPHCQQNRRTTLPRVEQPYNITNSGYRETELGRYTKNVAKCKRNLDRYSPNSKSHDPIRTRWNCENLAYNSMRRSCNLNSLREGVSSCCSNCCSYHCRSCSFSKTQKFYREPNSLNNEDIFSKLLHKITKLENKFNKVIKQQNYILDKNRFHEREINQQDIEEQKFENETFIERQSDSMSRGVFRNSNEVAGLALTDDLRNYNLDEDTDEYYNNCQDSLRSYNNQNDIFKTSSVSIYDGE